MLRDRIAEVMSLSDVTEATVYKEFSLLRLNKSICHVVSASEELLNFVDTYINLLKQIVDIPAHANEELEVHLLDVECKLLHRLTDCVLEALFELHRKGLSFAHVLGYFDN